MKRALLASSVAMLQTFAFSVTVAAQSIRHDSSYAIVPRPVKLVPQSGEFRITPATAIVADSAFASVAHLFTRDIAGPTGFTLQVIAAAKTPSSVTSAILLVRDTASISLGAEGYRLSVKSSGITIHARNAAGAFYALQSVRQLLPSNIYRDAPVKPTNWIVPAVEIEDTPRFSWRGMHLDVSRHFQPKEFVKKYIDLLAMHKMNRFHWHLTEDQGWRIEIKRYPKLTEVGSCRAQTMVPPYYSDPAKRVYDGKRHCGYYTQDDVREIVAYAAERFVTVVPEIEMPGHAQAAIAAYPELGVRTDTTVGVMEFWGVSEFILNAEPATVTFMQNVLAEVLELFPSQFIHIGGDEADKKQWKASSRIQERIRELGLKDEHELQSWFIRQMDNYLTQRGRRLIGWDEILEGGLADNATVMSWRGIAGGMAAARAGHDVVMAPNSHTYFDHYQSTDRAKEPHSIGGFISLERVYSFEPVPDSLTPSQAKHILGAQAQIWTEYIPNSKHVEYMAFPRAAALAEVVWSPAATKDYSNFIARLQKHLVRLDALDVNYRRLTPSQ